MSVPNQKIITIHQATQKPFVMIGIEEYREAFRKMQPCTFAMYLYLAGNAEGYRLELSKVAFENATGYKKNSYHRAYKELVELGYIYEDNGCLNFATSPKVGTKGVVQNWEGGDAKLERPIPKNETEESQNCNSSYSDLGIEINNTNNINKNREIDSPLLKENDYSYLDEIVCYEDGSFLWKGKTHFIDGNDPLFYERTRGYQETKMIETTPFKAKEIEYILTRMDY